MAHTQHDAFVGTLDDVVTYTLISYTPGVELTLYTLEEEVKTFRFSGMPNPAFGVRTQSAPPVQRTYYRGRIEPCVLADKIAQAPFEGQDTELYTAEWLEDEYRHDLALFRDDEDHHQILTSNLPMFTPQGFAQLVELTRVDD